MIESNRRQNALAGETTTRVDADTRWPTEKATDNADSREEPTAEPSDSREPQKPKRHASWSLAIAFGVLPGLALMLAVTAGFFRWQEDSAADCELARIESVQTAKDAAIAMLSYEHDSVEQELGAARDLLTGELRDSYNSLTKDVVIPGAKEKQISAVATVPAVASVSADPSHAVVLVFVNQTVVVGQDDPTDTASSVRMTLDKVDNRWLVSKFEPI